MTKQPEVHETEVQTQIRAFKQRYQNLGYGKGQYWLLCLAAFPIAVTPDMMYRLWNNFRQAFSSEIDRVAVSDVLLWPAWYETAPNLFELDEDIRNELLTELKQLGEERKRAIPESDLMQELAQFLYQYTIQNITNANDSLLQKAQLLGVQAMLAPGLAARQVEIELATHIRAGNESEILRMRNLVGALAGLHTDFEPLLSVTKGLKAHLLGMPQTVWQRQFVRPNEIAGGQVLGMAIDMNVVDGEPYLTVPLLKDMEGQLALPERSEQEKPKRLFLLTVGIDAYEGMPLRGCVNDTELLSEVLPNYFRADSQEVIKKILLNEEATKTVILEAFETQLNQAGPDDIVVFAFSGHGQNARYRAAQNTIATYSLENMRLYGDPEQLVANTITETEFRKLVRKAGKSNPHVLLITDTHNGSPNWLDRTNPKHIILTAGSDWDNVVESQYESKQHGAFTAALVTALRSTRARAPQTYHSLIRNIYQFMQNGSLNQTPQLFGTEQAVRRPFLSTDDSGILYAQEFFLQRRSTIIDQEISTETFDLQRVIDLVMKRYAGTSPPFSDSSKNEVTKRLEQFITTADQPHGFSVVGIGGPDKLSLMGLWENQIQKEVELVRDTTLAGINEISLTGHN